ncbi:MAG: hypothetical protein KAJ07_09705 [Planctomycetes bacterium]|nr:hypothetical protein [Planctomycetota bacterium]
MPVEEKKSKVTKGPIVYDGPASMRKVDITYMMSTFDPHKEFRFWFKPQVGAPVELIWNGVSWNSTGNCVDVILTESERERVEL